MDISKSASISRTVCQSLQLLPNASLDRDAWLTAIQMDDEVQIASILATSTVQEKNILLHEPLISSDADFTGVPINKAKFTLPFTLAAVYGSLKVCDVMIRNDVDVYLLESESYNVIHCLICVAFYQPENEEAVINTFRSLCRMLSKDVIKKLLYMEASHRLRPIEFAAHLGAVQIMLSIFETPDIYVIREDIIGAFVYQWHDITEYELADVPGSRIMISPMRLLSLISMKHLDRPDVRKMILEGVMADWMQRSISSKRHIIIFYSLFRLVYFSVLFIYEMDSKWLNDIGKISESQLHGTTNTSYPLKTYCNSALAISINEEMRILFEIFLGFVALLNVLYEIWVFYVDYYKHDTGTFPYADLKEKKIFIMQRLDFVARRVYNVGISILTLGEIILLRTTTAQDYETTSLSMMRFISLIFIQGSMIFFLQSFPGIGYLLISMRKMNWTFLVYLTVMAIFISAFSHLEMLFFNANSNEGCVDEFSSYFDTAVALLSTMLNTFSYTSYNVMGVFVLYLSHISYVFVVGILMYNLLIAIFSDTVSNVNERREIEITLCRLLTYNFLERKASQVPFCRKLYQRLVFLQLRRNYVVVNGTIFLVCARKVNKRILCG